MHAATMLAGATVEWFQHAAKHCPRTHVQNISVRSFAISVSLHSSIVLWVLLQILDFVCSLCLSLLLCSSFLLFFGDADLSLSAGDGQKLSLRQGKAFSFEGYMN